ncbi:hypothetical protein PhCBS80983_g03493 [Powellomyces hirtus]|uniref:Uncharacterized protein n=1 Tax=Powellomyces hirtus TaxID=109895 RepID=A0A507E489_9FUNG|nr:hypothetical protein PhCBS80983_g03493 [Powellomyces hirtus]
MDIQKRKRAAEKAAKDLHANFWPDVDPTLHGTDVKSGAEDAETSAADAIPKVSHLGQVSKRFRPPNRLRTSRLQKPPKTTGQKFVKADLPIHRPQPGSTGVLPSTVAKDAAVGSLHQPHETFGRELTGRVPALPQKDSSARESAGPSLDVILIGHRVHTLPNRDRCGVEAAPTITEEDQEDISSHSSGRSITTKNIDALSHKAPFREQPTQMEPMIVDAVLRSTEKAESPPETPNFSSFADVDEIVRKYTALVEARTRQLHDYTSDSSSSLEPRRSETASNQKYDGEFDVSEHDHSHPDLSDSRYPVHSSVGSVQKEVFMEPEMVVLVGKKNHSPPFHDGQIPAPEIKLEPIPAKKPAVHDSPDMAEEEDDVALLHISSYKGPLAVHFEEETPQVSIEDLVTTPNFDISWMEPARQEMVVTSLKAVMQNRQSKRRKMERGGLTSMETPKTFSFAKFHALQESHEHPRGRPIAPTPLLESVPMAPAVSTPTDGKQLYVETLEDLRRVESMLDDSVALDEQIGQSLQLTGRIMPIERIPVAAGSMVLGMSWTPAQPTLSSPARAYGHLRSVPVTPQRPSRGSRKEPMVKIVEPEPDESNPQPLHIPTISTPSLRNTPSMTLSFTRIAGFSQSETLDESENFSNQLVDSWVNPDHLYSVSPFNEPSSSPLDMTLAVINDNTQPETTGEEDDDVFPLFENDGNDENDVDLSLVDRGTLTSLWDTDPLPEDTDDQMATAESDVHEVKLVSDDWQQQRGEDQPLTTEGQQVGLVETEKAEVATTSLDDENVAQVLRTTDVAVDLNQPDVVVAPDFRITIEGPDALRGRKAQTHLSPQFESAGLVTAYHVNQASKRARQSTTSPDV